MSKGRVGLRRSRNAPALTGEAGEFGTIFSQLQSQDREGKDVTTTLDPRDDQRHRALQATGRAQSRHHRQMEPRPAVYG